MPQQEKSLKRLHSLQEIIAQWPFITEGLAQYNALNASHRVVTPEEFMRVYMHILDVGGLSQIVKDADGNPLSCSMGWAVNTPLDPPNLYVFWVYCNGRDAGAVKMMMEDARAWCRERGITKISAASVRTSGASIRWFEKKMGFKRDSITFLQEV